MSSILSPYPSSPPLLSSLIRDPPDAIPPIDDLQALQAELKLLQQKANERAKKAGNDLKAIEESMRRMKEKEKGKARAVEKVRKDRAYTPTVNGDDGRLSVSSVPSVKASYGASHTTNGVHSSRSSLDPRPSISDELKKKKKKRKRDDGSDVELEPQKMRKPSPALSQSLPPSHKPSKTTVSHSSTKVSHAIAAPDWSLPSSQSLGVTKPPALPPPLPGPSKPTEVKDDFSRSKAPPQVLVTTFYASIEPWLRPIKEEDIGFLEFNGDEVEPFVVPKLGRHYADVWEEEDIASYGAPLQSTLAARVSSISTTPPKGKWDPSTLTEPDLLSEERGHGPLTERLVSALLSIPNAEWRGVKAAEDAMEGRPANGATAAAGKEKLSAIELEQRLRDTMRYHGLLDSNPDYSEAVDDPIASALRQSQEELRRVLATNKARKERLVEIARDRLAHQEYMEARDSLDKNITTVYAKLQKKDAPKTVKKKKKGVVSANDHAGSEPPQPPAPVPCPAALGLGPDVENQLVIPDTLKDLVRTRRQWVQTVGGVFETKQKENPGRIWGLPPKSVFEGIDEEVRIMLGKDREKGDDGAEDPMQVDDPGPATSGKQFNGLH
ncbi:histone acetyltransferases subunit 3-domain-containing protein [Thelephora terrestris]|uniref:Histone acetyltransferases subunit 3-domain-containing protein n=1 Tax=Thelephora terrestris TaxID=56493 RepID=A0A9P6HCF3_9AGAM|nr:histone acetyltransferases subunit 3-domain-containing protein [Thelephora terrestris]